jgi:hypothetical protein
MATGNTTTPENAQDARLGDADLGQALEPPAGSSGARPRKNAALARRKRPLPLVRAEVPPRWQGLVDWAERGSLVARIHLACLDCACWQEAEVRHCTVEACALHSVRPYQPRG